MKATRFLIYLSLMTFAFVGCKTTEENYRQAYERTIAARAEQDSIDQTIYGKERRNMEERTVATAGGEVSVKVQFVRVTKDGGGIPENLRRYNVVVGQFKQLFNAQSFRNRLADGPCPGAFVVETAEPYYFIVAASFSGIEEAVAELEKIKRNNDIKMKSPCPFILDATARRSPAAHKKR